MVYCRYNFYFKVGLKMITKDDEIEFLNAQLDYMAKELRKEKARVKAMQDHVNEIDDFEIAILDAKDRRVIN
jgi:nitrogen fixation/metabolism regulation signal transduction histidine kinase